MSNNDNYYDNDMVMLLSSYRSFYNFFIYNNGVTKILTLLKDNIDNNDKLMTTLLCLETCCKDYEFSCSFGNNGGHSLIKRLKKTYSSSNDDVDNSILEVLESIECNIISSGCTYPIVSLTLVDNDSNDDKFLPDIFTFNYINDNYHVFLKRVPKSMHGHGQKSVGYILWSGAIILSRWINANNDQITDKRVLEIGAGLGLCGIVAAKYAKHLTMTDYNEIVLNTLAKNVEINTRNSNISNDDDLLGGYKAALANSNNIDVSYLDWDTLEIEPFSFSYVPCNVYGSNDSKTVNVNTVKENNDDNYTPLSFPTLDKYDVIIASDMICCENDAIGIAKSLKIFLKDDGISIFVIPQPRFRYGTEALIPALTAIGMKVLSRPIFNSKYNNDLYDNKKTHNDDNNNSNSIINSNIISDEELTENIHDSHYIAWNLIIATW